MSSLRHHRKVKGIRARKEAKREANRLKKILKAKKSKKVENVNVVENNKQGEGVAY